MKRLLVVVATAIAAVVVTSVWVHNTDWAGWHIRECGFDSQGMPYAVVRDNTIGGAKHEDMRVYFELRPHAKLRGDPPASRVNLPTFLGTAIGGVTTVVHGTEPIQGDNGPKKVYCTLAGHGNNDSNE